jgi:hypothetical protein
MQVLWHSLAPDHRGLLFAIPTATAKYRNMIENCRASQVIDNRENSKADYLGAEAIMIFGRAREVRQKR